MPTFTSKQPDPAPPSTPPTADQKTRKPKGHTGEPSPYRDQVGTVQQEGEATHCSFSGPIKLEAARWLESKVQEVQCSSVFLLYLRERCATRRRLLKESTKGGSGCSLSSKTSPFFPTFIISPPVYSHTALLDDFFWRPFPYTRVEATRVFPPAVKALL
jgi:hypothetical protein